MILFIYCIGLIGVVKSYEGNITNTPEVIYQWVSLEFIWPNETMKQDYIANEDYIPENNAINGIKVYNDTVYLTIPKLKKGVPATLHVVVTDGTKSPKLQPYPNWDMHRKDDCNALYLVQSMEIDPNTGFMWILDTGLVAIGPIDIAPIDRCPPKLVIYDINEDQEVHRYVFDSDTIGAGMFYLNDIVLDYGADGTARFAYISDTLGRKLVVYDRAIDKGYYFAHESMQPDPAYGTVTISNNTNTVNPLGINGIAISSDFQYVYYSSVAGVGLYQVSTTILRDSFANNPDYGNHVRKVGDKIIQGDGMYYGKNHNLYYSTLGKNAVYKWPVLDDIAAQEKGASAVEFVTQTNIAEDMRMEWIDSFGMDENGFLWFTSNNLHTFFGNSSEPGAVNFYVWKVYVDDSSYLNITGLDLGEMPVQRANSVTSSVLCTLFCVWCFFILYL